MPAGGLIKFRGGRMKPSEYPLLIIAIIILAIMGVGALAAGLEVVWWLVGLVINI